MIAQKGEYLGVGTRLGPPPALSDMPVPHPVREIATRLIGRAADTECDACGGGSVDLTDRRRTHPTPSRPAPGRQPSPSVGEVGGPGPARTRPDPPGVQESPPEPALSGLRAKLNRPGPDRPLGSKNRRPATRYDVGRTTRCGHQTPRKHHRTGPAKTLTRLQKGTTNPASRNPSNALPMHSAAEAPSALIPPYRGPPEAANVQAG